MGAWLFVGVSFTLTRLGDLGKLTGGNKSRPYTTSAHFAFLPIGDPANTELVEGEPRKTTGQAGERLSHYLIHRAKLGSAQLMVYGVT